MSWLPVNTIDHTFLPALFRKNPVVFDFGVNGGNFSKFMIERFDATVFGAEPSSHLFASLPSHPNLHVMKVAVGGRDGTATLQLYTARCASLYSGANDESGGAEVVPVLSLRTFFERAKVEFVDLLKVDIEGAELDLFEEAQDSDLLRCGQIAVEFHDFMIPSLGPRVEAVKARLEASGFRRINFSLNNGDVLFVRRDLLSFPSTFFLRGPYKYAAGVHRRIRRILSA